MQSTSTSLASSEPLINDSYYNDQNRENDRFIHSADINQESFMFLALCYVPGPGCTLVNKAGIIITAPMELAICWGLQST